MHNITSRIKYELIKGVEFPIPLIAVTDISAILLPLHSNRKHFTLLHGHMEHSLSSQFVELNV